MNTILLIFIIIVQIRRGKNVKEARRGRLYFKCLSWWYVYVRFSMQEGYVSLSSVGEHDKAQEHLEDKDKAAFVLVCLLHVLYIRFDLEIIDKLNVISIAESVMCY